MPTHFKVVGTCKTARAFEAVSKAATEMERFLGYNPSRRSTAYIEVRYRGKDYVARAKYTSEQGAVTVAVAFA